MIDYFFANYTDKDMGNYETSHSILVIIHVVISNIFLLNYLVAILTTVYDIMIRNGDFYSIEYQYIFLTKYLLAIEERNGYESFIMMPPPLNYLILPLVLVAPGKEAMKKFSRYFQNVIYWFENMLFLIFAFISGVIVSPYLIIKTYT